VIALLALAGAGLLVRLAKIQLLDHERLASLARRIQIKREPLCADRGRLLDRNGNLLAFSTDNPSVYVDRAKVQDARAAASALVELGLPISRTIQRLGGTGHAPLTRELLPEPRVHEIVAAHPGLYVMREPKRVYPRGSLARQVIGRWSEERELLAGVEFRLDDVLTGEGGWETVVCDGHGGQYATGSRSHPRSGADVVLTLDRSIQDLAESALARAIETHDAEGGVVVVLDPMTGDVLAMASHGSREEGPGFTNRAVTHPIEIGSCAKLVVAAAALEAGVCDTSTTFFCGRIPGEEHPPLVRDDHGAAAWLSFQKILVESRNTGTARIARRVGPDRLYEAIRRFGFGSPTGIELPGESGGSIRPPSTWSGTSLDAIAIGYEYLATPLQWASAYASVANGGLLLRPRLVRETRDPETGTRRVVDTEVVRRVMTEETADLLRAVFHRVTRKGGTGTAAALPWVRVAGKTGTARKLDRESGTYGNRDHVASFVGFAPLEKPRVLCLVSIDGPKGRHYGGEVAAPVFHTVLSGIAAIYPNWLREDLRHVTLVAEVHDAAPGEALAAPLRHTVRELPDFRGLATLSARRLGIRRGYEPEVLGTGERVVYQEPAPGTRGVEAVVLYTEGEAPTRATVPDLIGCGYREAVTRLGAVGLSARRQGLGRVVAQVPGPGEIVASNTTVALALEDLERDWGTP
jgi:cell division protein FtsI (penicillin-binding protein 3)